MLCHKFDYYIKSHFLVDFTVIIRRHFSFLNVPALTTEWLSGGIITEVPQQIRINGNIWNCSGFLQQSNCKLQFDLNC